MILDIQQMGTGAGLVMVGWVAGLCVSIVFSIIRRLTTV